MVHVGRREFVGALGGALLTPATRAWTQADPARVSVDYQDAGRSIAADFIALSYESAILSPGTYFTPDNASLLALLRSLGGAGVLRIGGNTSERTVWEPVGTPAADSF